MIVFFDIDGTLITEDERHFLPPSTKKAIQEMRKNGHFAFINTGRTRFNTIEAPYIKEIEFDGFICACGAHIIYNDQDLFAQTVPLEAHNIIIQAARKYGMQLMLEGPDTFYFDDYYPMSDAIRELCLRDKKHSRHVMETDKVFNKFVTWDTKSSQVETFVDTITPWFTYIDRGNGFREFCLKNYSKATGIAYIAKLLNQPISSCIVIGDSMNDLPMLEYVPHSVLMGNGTPSLRSRVEYVTTDILDNGIQNALMHYKLI